MGFSILQQALLNLPDSALQPLVCNVFVSALLKILDFDLTETIPEFATGHGTNAVDYAVRRNFDDDIFIHTKLNPHLLIEVKGKSTSITPNSAQYKSTVNQLKGYLLSPKCQSTQWGIITNANHIQLLRKHGKVIHPVLPCLEITLDNVDEVVSVIKQKIDEPQKALTVAIYNNKGGVGKTTTTLNLAAIFAKLGKRTLIVDFDPNQQDLTNSLGLKSKDDSLYSWLVNQKSPAPNGLINTCKFSPQPQIVWQFDIIASDNKLQSFEEQDLRKLMNFGRLRQVLEPLKLQYDYILIDSPPNWRLFSQSAVYTADVVLIPTKHNSIFSLENAATVLERFIPDIQDLRKDGGPTALPIFYNGETITEPAKLIAQQTINRIISLAQNNKDNPVDLTPYFYPKYSLASKNLHIFNIPGYAHIAGAMFSRVPAAYKNKIAYEHYFALTKEYFLQ